MSFRREAHGGVEVLRAARLAELGVPHAFGTRRGGVSTGRFTSLNAALFGADAREHVVENWRRLAAGAGLPGAPVRALRQVHGVEILDGDAAPGDEPVEVLGEGDAVRVGRPGVVAGVTTADCVPVLVYAGASVAALHCGWRSARSGLLPRYLATLPEPPVAVALGPHIRRCHFEVGPEVLAELEEAAAAAGGDPARVVAPGRGERPHADLEELLLLQLEGAGVPRDRVDAGAPCTFCDPETWFSYRRDGPGGLLGHGIGLPAPA